MCAEEAQARLTGRLARNVDTLLDPRHPFRIDRAGNVTPFQKSRDTTNWVSRSTP
jgi:hypothetical protein